jgi:hypothetical protein
MPVQQDAVPDTNPNSGYGRTRVLTTASRDVFLRWKIQSNAANAQSPYNNKQQTDE